MKVFVANFAMDLGGGTDLVALTMARTLLRYGFDVELRTVLPTNWEVVRRMFPDIEPIPERCLSRRTPPSSLRGVGAWTLRTLRYASLLVRLWRDRRHAVVVNANGDLVAAPAHLTYVYFPVTAASRWAEAGPLSSRPLMNIVARGTRFPNLAFIRLTRARILAVSRFTQRALRRVLDVDAQVLYPPVKLFLPPTSEPRRSNSVVTVASFRTRKRLERVFDVALKVPEASFHVLGTAGPVGHAIWQGLQSMASAIGLGDRVSFVIDSPRHLLEYRYWTSKVYLHPTPQEHFGISAVEAMMAGCVPVVPRSGGQWEDVLQEREGEWGYGYDDAREAAERISTLLSDPDLWRRMSRRAQERAVAFSEETFSRNFLQIFKEVTADGVERTASP